MRTFATQHGTVAGRVTGVAGLFVLGACSTVPIVETGHLNPVVQRYSVNAGMYFDGEFQDFLHTEERSGGKNWEVFLGGAQRDLFGRILDASFDTNVVIEDLDNIGNYDVDFVIYPKIVEYAYLAPEDSGSDFYAVSIKYTFKIFDAAGEEVTGWTTNAYGKNRSSLLKGKESLSEATNIALRDAATAVLMEFESNDELIALLNPQAEADSATPGPANEEPESGEDDSELSET